MDCLDPHLQIKNICLDGNAVHWVKSVAGKEQASVQQYSRAVLSAISGRIKGSCTLHQIPNIGKQESSET